MDHLSPDLYSRRGCTRITTLGQLPAIIVSNGPKQGLCSANKNEAAKLQVASSFPEGIQVCVGEDLSFHIVDLTFQNQWDLFQVQCQPQYSGGFACLGSPHSSLATHTGATIEVEVARCKNCSSKLCCPHFSPDLYGRRGCTRITTLGQLPATIV